jgi:uncharacterized protein (TIGR03437 family)
MSPNSAVRNSGEVSLTLTGSGFVSGDTVKWEGSALTTTFVSATQLGARIPAGMLAALGTYMVRVQHSDGALSAALPFVVRAETQPVLVQLSRSSAVAGDAGFTLAVTGSGFTQTTALLWNGAPLAGVSVTETGTSISAAIPAPLLAAAGSAAITARNGDVVSNALPFTIVSAVTLETVSPASVKAKLGNDVTLTITGKGLLNTVAHADNWAMATVSSSDTQLVATLPASMTTYARMLPITLWRGDQGSNPLYFVVAEPDGDPVITSISPATVAAGSPNTSFTVTGTNLTGANLLVGGNSVDALSTATQLTTVLRASLLTTAGTFAVTAVRGWQSSNALTLTVTPAADAPVLTSLTPASAPAGSQTAVQLTVTGTRLAGATLYADSLLLGNPSASDTQISGAVPAQFLTAARALAITARRDGLVSNALTFTVSAVDAAPAVAENAIVNAASYKPQIAPGSLISIFGTGLAAGEESAKLMPLPLTLQGAKVLVNGQAAPLLYVSPTQINAQAPYETPDGPAMLEVRSAGKSSGMVSFTVSPAAPGVLYVADTNHAIAQNYSDWSLNQPSQPAKPGDWVVVYLTGLGATNEKLETGAPAPADRVLRPLAPATVTLGGQSVANLAIGLVPGFVGLGQLNLQIPDVAAGEQPLEVRLGGVSANRTLLSVGAK